MYFGKTYQTQSNVVLKKICYSYFKSRGIKLLAKKTTKKQITKDHSIFKLKNITKMKVKKW